MTNGQTIKRNPRGSSAERKQTRTSAAKEAALELAGESAVARSLAHEVWTPCDCGDVENCTMERYIADVRIAYAEIAELRAGRMIADRLFIAGTLLGILALGLIGAAIAAWWTSRDFA